jgi:hypothetical protein
MFPRPPVLKTTIIQLNKELDSDDQNYEILTNEYTKPKSNDNCSSPANTTTKKKRRRSSANVDSEELAKRKHETKQLHSIIEKRRRIKINREFEALKYLIPACRTTSPDSKKSSNNGNKIDGMYKLTILKSSVEYILYLHHIIQKQSELIGEDFDVDFTRIPLDVNQYRNIDKEFSFSSLQPNLIEEEDEGEEEDEDESDDLKSDSEKNDIETRGRNGSDMISTTSSSTSSSSTSPSSISTEFSIPKEKSMKTKPTDTLNPQPSNSISQLPSPDITPDMAPILSLLNKYSNISTGSSRKHSLPISPNTVMLQTPLSSAYKSSIRRSNSFTLPDPALNPESQMPKRKMFKSRPLSDTIVFSGQKFEERLDERSEEEASNTLLALRKSNIDSLLN